MIKKIVKNKMAIIVLAISIIFIPDLKIKAGGYDPGSDKDPIITKSYLEVQISKLKEYIDNKNNSTSSIQTSAHLEVVTIKKGQNIIFENGSEVILRSGKANIIDSENGGIADLTIGTDLRMNYEVPSNHLLLIPKSDGRGLNAESNCTLLVKGKYIIN